MKNWKEIRTLPIILQKGQWAEIDVDVTGKPFLSIRERQPIERDVTSECTVELKPSSHTKGFYCHIKHKGRSIVALGVDDASKANVMPGYRLKKASGAIVSFNIIKTEV